jgi:TolB-like protein/tetratricopeptide (TPR) repeat protein
VADRDAPETGGFSALLEELARIPEAPADTAWLPRLEPGLRIGRFELRQELGRGAFGVVFEALDGELGRQVAFKILKPGRDDLGAEQLRREAEIVARLTHPNLVTLHDVGRCEHGPYLVLERLRGTTLARRLEAGPLAPTEALRISTQVARGLAHAHASGVVHRDLKPSNVFLCTDGLVKVLDFGLAHAFGRRRLEGGSPDYMAPEQWRGAPEDERTDVFALGVVLYRALTGQRPFPKGREAVTGNEPAPSLEIPDLPGLGELVGRMLAKDPVDRPRDGQATLEALEALVPEPSATASGTTALRIRRRARRNHLWLAAAAVLVAVGLGGAGLQRWWSSTQAPAGPPSIAVLPFADLSPNHDQEYFSDGLTEEILDALAHVDGLRVSGRTSAFAFKGKSDDLRVIGQKLGASVVLEGSVRRDGGRVRVTAQLVKTSDGFHLWSQSYERELTGIFAVQDEIAAAVVAALKVRLLAPGADRPHDHRTGDPEVFREYLLGRQLLRTDDQDRTAEAVQAFERALARDGTYAPAWAGLAEAVYWAYGNEAPDEATLRDGRLRAAAAADRAVALAPDLPDGYAARALLRSSLGADWAGAETDLRKAISLSPGTAELHWRMARDVLGPLGRLDEAVAAVRRATDLDPLSASAWSVASEIHLAARQLGPARAAAVRSLELKPRQDSAPTFLAGVELMEQRPAKALEAMTACGEKIYRDQYAAMALHDLGREAEAQAALAALKSAHAHDAPFQIAVVHAWRGEKDLAFAWLDRALAAQDGGLRALRMEPLLRQLEGDPRLAKVERTMGLPPR